MADVSEHEMTPQFAVGLASLAGLRLNPDQAAALATEIESLRESIEALGDADMRDAAPATAFRLKLETVA